MPDISIDYDASVPMSEKAPFSVEAKGGVPPGRRFRDFIPRKDGNNVPKEKNNRPKGKVYKEKGPDFISHAESTSRKKGRKKKIQDLAKSLYIKKKQLIRDYEQAAAMVNKASEEEKKDPSDELRRAMKIYSKGRPYTKKRAMQDAELRVMRGIENGRDPS